MTRRVLTLAIFVMATTAVASQTVQSPSAVLGAGQTTCETWLSGDRATRPDPVQMSWVLGYISAVGTTVTFQRETNQTWMFGVLDGHCSASRTDTLADAAKSLAQILQRPD